MTKTAFLAATSLASLLLALAPAQAAGLNRAWVSGHGADAAGCGAPANPCRTFQYVHDNIIAPGGEIDVLDPAGYGAVTITKALSIVNDGVGTAGVQQSSSGQDAITISASASDAIHLRGLNIDGLGVARYGVSLNTAGSLEIVNCVTRHFTSAGISISPFSGSLYFSIIDTIVSDNGEGISVSSSQQNVAIVGSIKGVAADHNNPGDAVDVAASGSSETASVTVVDTEASGNGGYGFLAEGGASGAVLLALRGVTASGNRIGVASFSDGADVQATLAHSLLVKNGYGTSASGGVISSYGDNDINFNGTDVVGALTPLGQK